MIKKLSSLAAFVLLTSVTASAQVTIKGVLNNNRYDDGEQMKSTWIGSLYDEQGNYTGKTAFIVDNGIYKMDWNGSELSTPVKDPEVNINDIKQGSSIDYEKAIWATNFNLMVGNSGAVHVGDKIVTVFSRDYQSTEDHEIFAVRKWDEKTGNLLSNANDYMPLSSNIESAGMSYNPVDGKVYGLFHVTDFQLPEEITSDPNYSVDQDDTDWNREGVDDGYLIGTIDLATMEMTPITPGLYYGNFVTFAINSEGRAFALTSGGSNGYEGADGKIYNIDNELGGAQPIEFDLNTGLMIRNAKTIYEGTDSAYVEYTYPYPATGYCSQVSRQAACFSKSNPNKMYWVGFYNSGKGVNDYGSWSTLSDKEWRTNGKYDTALYELDLLTGDCKRLAKVPNRCSFSCIWLESDDPSEGADIDITKPNANDSIVALTLTIDESAILKTKVQKGETTLYLQPKDGWKVSHLAVNNADCLSKFANGSITFDVNKNTEVYVLYEWADTENLYTETTADGIIEIADEGIKVQSKDGKIYVDGAAGKTVKIFTTGGSQVATVVPSEGKTGIFTVNSGIYIVQVGNKAAKVMVQ